MTSATPLTVTCERHGELVAAVVCRHHLEVSDHPVGFVENSDDPNDQQAWCDNCEQLFLREGAMTDEFRKFNDFAMVASIAARSYERCMRISPTPRRSLLTVSSAGPLGCSGKAGLECANLFVRPRYRLTRRLPR
jgi:hypothetical protein